VPADGSSPPAKLGVRCQLKPVCDASGPVWTPDGRMVVDLAQGREKTHGELGQIERFSLELIGKRGTQRTIFARDNWSGDAKEATVSPDGRTLVYMAWNSWKTKPANGTALYSIRIDGTRNRQLTRWTFGAGDHPAFSPDRRTVFFRSFAEDESKQADYYTVDVRTRRTTRLTHFEEGTTVLSGSYSPDGKWIAHGTDGLDGNADVFVMRADGSGNRPVTRSSQWDSAPDWGPSGS
jgi:TolB protein